jgi:pantoate--beta-alanine ligase
MFEAGERGAAEIIGRMRDVIMKEPLATLDYVEIVDLDELNPVAAIGGDVLAAVAVYIGRTRLIDNIILKVKGN